MSSATITFRELAEVTLDQREEQGIKGFSREQSRYRVHVVSAPFIDRPVKSNGHDCQFGKNRANVSRHPSYTPQLLAHDGCLFSRSATAIGRFSPHDVAAVATGRYMPKAIDLSGATVGRLTVISHAGRQRVANRMRHCWNVRCECGTEFVIDTGPLRDGRTSSCGCLRTEMTIARSTKHGGGGRETRSGEYKAWRSMRSRCMQPNNIGWSNYGGRGIRVCDRWANDFAAFLSDMGRKPSPRHTIDRIDPNGNYEPTNCRWASSTEQNRNRRNNRRIQVGLETLTLVGWSERTGILANTISGRLARGWSPERAVSEPTTSVAKESHAVA